MALNFDSQGKNVDIVIPIASVNTTDGVINATKNGAAYAQAASDMDVDKLRLNFAMSSNVNSAGSGNFSIGVYVNNVSMTAAAISVAYNSANPYTTVDRASLAVKSIAEGDIIRVDVLAVPGGAATSYPQNAIVRLQGPSKG